MIIVDTNILVYLYIQGEYTQTVEELLDIDCHWAAPILWRSEFRNVLALYLRKQIISFRDAINIIEEAEYFMSDREYQLPSESVLELVNSSRCSSYDCEFVSLAKQFDVPLITQDKKILVEFPRHAIKIQDFMRSHQ